MALVDEALDQPSDQRLDWIKAQTEGEPALRDRVLALLAATDRSSDMLVTGGAGLDEDDEPPPSRIGAYRITDKIGQGGMGAVWKGERETGDFTHVVAVKIIRSGLLSDPVIERFGRERQVLADLAHPNIARLFDGGSTPDGRPYIIMELVDGLPITDWADDKGLNLRERLALILPVADAVSFAHRNLIIHRDLTPSNVLVTTEGVIKLIDFGIAKPPEAEAPRADHSLANLSLTPGFAAPERHTGAAASTLIDVYSLGRLLASLLGDGARPAEVEAIIRRATAEAPSDRYPSVEALADDVRAWLSGHPVAASGGGRRYRFGKFVSRHRRVALASVAGVAALTVALGVTFVAWRGADAARAAEAERFEQVRALAGYMLFDLNARLERTPGNTEARVRLAAEAQRYLTTLADTPGAAADVRLDTARGFIQLARIQGVPPFPNFGEGADATASLGRAEALLARLAENGRSPAALAPDRARAAAFLALVALHGDRDPQAADGHLARAGGFLDAVPASARDRRWHEAQRDVRLADLEVAYLEDGLEPLEAALARKEADMAAWPEDLRRDLLAEDRAVVAYWRGQGQSYSGEGDNGVTQLQIARGLFAEVERSRPGDPQLLYWLVWTDYTLFSAAANVDRIELSSAALARARETLGRLLAIETADQGLHSLSINLDESYAQDLGNQGRFAEAIAAQQAVVARRLQTVRLANRTASSVGDLAFSQATLGVIARKAGDRALACSSWDAAAAGWGGLEATGDLMGFHATLLDGVRRNLERCAAGAPVSAFGPLTGAEP